MSQKESSPTRSPWAAILIVMVAVGAHFGFREYRSQQTRQLAKRLAASEIHLTALEKACKEYRAERGEWPSALSDLPNPDPIVGAEDLFTGTWVDPMNGLPFVFRPQGSDDLEIGSWGSDGLEGGDGFAVDRLTTISR